MDEIDTFATEYITCPKCGATDQDCWEHKKNSGEEMCICGAKFKWEREIEVTYTTALITNQDK